MIQDENIDLPLSEKITMKYLAPFVVSLSFLFLPFVTGGRFSWAIVGLCLVCLWISVALGEEIGKNK